MSLRELGAILRNLDWLALFLVSWILPLAFDAWRPLTYATSLLFWLVPAFLLWPRFASLTDSGGRRRTAFFIAVGQIVVLGAALDFGLGRWVLWFDAAHPERYLLWLGPIPIEEMFFYALGPIAILLVYAWCDEYWIAAYNQVEARVAFARAQSPLITVSWPAIGLGLILFGIGVFIKQRHLGGSVIPLYYTFLVVLAFLPAALLYKQVSSLVNWRAFGITTLYVVITSMVWEPVLALPRGWWWYRDDAMMGIWAEVFTRDVTRRLPIEAVIVWVAAPFASVFTYEAAKAWLYRRRPEKAVFGLRRRIIKP